MLDRNVAEQVVRRKRVLDVACRSAAKQAFTVGEFEKQMDGIFTTSVGRDTLDECPMAYKSMEAIVDNIGETSRIYEQTSYC